MMAVQIGSRLQNYSALPIFHLDTSFTDMAEQQTKFKNTWQPPVVERIPNVHLDTEPEDYDYNFMFEPKVLTGHRVQLRPVVVSCKTVDSN